MQQPPITPEMLAAAVRHHLPQRDVLAVEDRGVWIRHNFKITLDQHEIVYLKLDQDFSASEKEAYLCGLLASRGLPAPAVLALDTSRRLLPAPFIIQAYLGGERLGDLLKRANQQQEVLIYQALGQFYRALHSIHHPHSGWIEGAGLVLPFSPAAHQYNEVIVRIGQEAVEKQRLSPGSHQKLCQLWSESLPWLDLHSPSLVSGALHWTVCLEQAGGWHVTRLTDLHDMLYWDPAWDLASIRYPVFQPPLPEERWQAFAAVYGSVPEEKRLRLYALMQHLDAAMGNYMEPFSTEHEQWKASVWHSFDSL
jgi:aminoglycoside phosphotransferase (APT) family kinase protein